MILSPPLAFKRTLDMPVGAVRWFIDGTALLAHVEDLAHVRAKVVCAACESWGGGGDVRVVQRPEAGDVFIACGHRPHGGRVKLGTPLDVEPLLLSLGWAFRCTDCGGPLEGDNVQGATVFTVTCPCTIREYRLPVA